MTQGERNPHAGVPFTDDDATIAAALEDVSVPALLCSLVHITGDPSWIRGDLRPAHAVLNDYQGGHERRPIRPRSAARALPGDRRLPRRRLRAAAAAVARAGHEMMSFLACGPVGRRRRADVPRGPPPRRRRQRRHHVGRRGPGRREGRRPHRRHRLRRGRSAHRHPPGPGRRARSPSSRRTTGPAAPGGTTATRARGSTSAATSTATRSSRPTTGASTSPSSRSCKAYFARVARRLRHPARTAASAPRSLGATYDEATGRWAVTVQGPPTGRPRCSTPASWSARSVPSTSPSCPTSPAWTTSPGRRSTPPAGTRESTATGTRFALVGAGASGFQIAPTIADEVEHLTVFQRTAQWMFPNANYHAPVPRGRHAGRCATCRSTAGGSAS